MEGPGPGQYNGDYTRVKNRNGVAAFGKGSRNSKQASDGPGPGAYMTPKNKSGPAYHMGARISHSKTADGPGPGAYNSRIDAV